MGDQFLRTLKEAPFLRLLFPFAFGIFLSDYSPFGGIILLIVLLILAAVLVMQSRTGIVIRFKTRSLTGLILHLLLFVLGIFLGSTNDIRKRPDWFGPKLEKADGVVICIEEPPVRKDKTFKANASVRRIYARGKSEPASGNFILYYPRDDSSSGINYGSLLLVPSEFVPVVNTGNPGAFDYAAYCRLQNIYHQIFLRKDNYRVLTGTHKRSFSDWLFASQQKIVLVLERYVGGPEAGLAEALLIGYKNNLDKSMLQQYAESGIIHVVAISGMHLGLIYWMLSSLLSAAETRRARWIRALLIFAGLWTFTLIAGASASVVRSAVMFSLILVGELINRKSSALNGLASSAFLLLAFNPYWLWDLGFQLSYAALASIMFFMKPVYKVFYVQNGLLDMIWKMCATCLAAQILTTPLVLLLSSRFPVFFLITNLVAIPLSSLIVLGEVALCMLSFIEPLAGWLGNLLAWLISCMNRFVITMNQLPFATVYELYQEVSTMVVLYASIGTIVLTAVFRKAWLLLLTLGLLALYAGLQLYYYMHAENQHMLIVYNIPSSGVIELVNGRAGDFAQSRLDEAGRQNAEQVLFAAHNRLRINRQQRIFLSENRAVFRGRKIVYLRQAGDMLSDWQSADYLIISNLPAAALKRVLDYSAKAQLIFDSSVPRSKAARWMQSANDRDCYSVALNGAFIVNLN
jgi:competence protein ComEC